MQLKSRWVLLLLLITLPALGQKATILEDLVLEESLTSAMSKIKAKAGSLRLVEPKILSFPLASEQEVHLVCQDYKIAEGIISEIVFTFADDKLSFIQAHGNVVELIVSQQKDTAQTYLDYLVFWDKLIFAKPVEDKVWILSEAAAHPNLFTWDNPYLPVNGGVEVSYDSSVRIPDYLNPGVPLDSLQPILKSVSKRTQLLELDDSDPNAQLQLDCFGVEYAGFPRKIEARFGNNKLNMVWILTGKGEEARLRQRLIALYGPIIYSNEAWDIFHSWQLHLRKDKPEILVLSKELAEFYKKDYFKQ